MASAGLWQREFAEYWRNNCLGYWPRHLSYWRRRQPQKTRAQRALRLEALEPRAMLSGTATWNGMGATNNLSDSGNYAGNAAPGTGDSVVFAGSTQTSVNNNISGLSLNNVEFQTDSFTVGGNALGITGDVQVDADATATFTTAITSTQLTMTGPGTLIVTSTANGLTTVSVQDGTLVATSNTALPVGCNLQVGDPTPFEENPVQPPGPTFSRPAPNTQPSDATLPVSAADVTYGTDDSTLTADDFGLGTATRSYSSGLKTSTGGLGNWMLADQPYATRPGNSSTVKVVLSANACYGFTQNTDGSYSPVNGIQEKLAAGANGTLVFTTRDGTIYEFNGFSFGADDARNGQFLAECSPNGDSETVAALDANHCYQISTLDFTASGSSTPYQVEQIAYDPGDGTANTEHIASIALEDWNGSELTPMRQVDYAYYDGSTSLGKAGDLESATEYVNGGLTAVGTSYYRYANGYLAVALSPQGYSNAVATLGPLANVATAELVPYSCVAFQYASPAQGHVSVATVDGLQVYAYSFSPNVNNIGSSGKRKGDISDL